jgi:hypothetical protein
MRSHKSSSRWMAPLLAVVLSAFGTLAGAQELQTPSSAFAPLPEDSVEVHDAAEPVPDSAVSVAQFTVPESMVSHTDEQVIAVYRPQAARLGATWIALDLRGGQRRVVAYHVPASVRIRHAARESGSRPAATSAPASTGSGTVHVRGYYRRDGTYVRPHTRSRPRRN